MAAKKKTSELAVPELSMGTLSECMGAALRFAQHEIYSRTCEILAPLDLTPGSFTVLLLIKENPKATQSEIGGTLVMKKANFTTLVARLERRGLVIREPCRDDRRRQRLVLSPAGREVLAHAATAHDSFNATLSAHMGRCAHLELIRLLNHLRRAPQSIETLATPVEML